MTFLDLMTNMTGAVMILMLFALKEGQNKPCPRIPYQGKVYYDPQSGKVFGDLAPSSAGVETNDSVLVTVVGFQDFPKPSEAAVCPPCTQLHGKEKCDRTHCDDPACPKGSGTPEQECSIALSTQASGCQGKESYTVKVSVSKSGACASDWTDGSGRTWAYGSEITFGPYPIAQGAKTITVWDSQSPPMRRSATVLPPTGCGNAGGKDPTIIQIEKRLVGYVPPGRRAILYWENEASNIDIIVEKEGGAKIKGGQNDRDWGEWYRDKSKWMGRRSTEEGVKLYAIGTYKVFAKNKTGPSGPDTQKVKLALTNSIGARESVENDFQISKDGGEVWLADIRITDQGINIIKINNDIKK